MDGKTEVGVKRGKMPGEVEKDLSVVRKENGSANGDRVNVDSDGIPQQSLSVWKGGPSRLEKSIKQLEAAYGSIESDRKLCVRVPGRVNLIGEHIDYCGYGVFPMAIEQDVFIVARVRETSTSEEQSVLRITNTDAKYTPFECPLSGLRELLEGRGNGVPGWHLYFLCGALGVLEHLKESLKCERVSLDVCVDGRVPARAGLSSSSALVCAAALTTLVALKGEMGRKEMATLCAMSERYIGTQGGGMDQAIAFLATSGTAQLIEFVPELKGMKVKLPSNAVFVIANSLVEANKAASDGYNIRVAECRLATWILAKVAGLEDFEDFSKVKLLQIKLGLSVREMLELVEANIHEMPYSAQEVGEILGVPLDELRGKPLMNKIPLDSLELKLFQRITHVLKEAERVLEFRRVSTSEEDNLMKIEECEVLTRLGELMNESHRSLRDLYECSHPQLDTIVHLSQTVCHGARLTGAGWGGCMVALLEEGQVKGYLELLKKKYYVEILGIQDIDPHVFITQPGPGATILSL